MSGDSERRKDNEKKRKIGEKEKVMESEGESDANEEYEECELQNKLDELESRMSGMGDILDEKLRTWSEIVDKKMSLVMEEVVKKVIAKLNIADPEELGNKVNSTYDREIENKSKVIKLEERIKKLEGSLAKMEEDWVRKFDEMCEKMNENMVNSVKELVEKEVGNLSKAGVGNVWINKSLLSEAKIGSSKIEIPKAQLDVLEDAANEVREREKRKKNVIVFGLRKSDKVEAQDRFEEDKNKIERIFEFLKVADIEVEKIIRYKNGKENNDNSKEKIPPVLLVLKNDTDKLRILKLARTLKNSSEFGKIFINSDQTLAERTSFSELKKLRDLKQSEEVDNKYIWIIRGKEVLKVLKRVETINNETEGSMQH